MTTRDVYRRHRDDKRHAGRCRGLVSKLFRAVPRGALRNLPLTGPDGAKPAMSLALDDLDAEIRVMQAEKVERQQQQVCEAMDQVRLGRDPFGCLPMQSQSSLELHSAIVEHYSNRHQIGKEISSVSRRQARRQRKAKAKGADYADRNTSSIACKLSKRKRRQQLK